MNDTPSGLAVGAVMTKNPVAIDVGKSLLQAYEEMDKYNCRHLAVTEKDQLVGILSQRDITLSESVTKEKPEHLKVGDAYVAFPYRADETDPLEKVLDDMMMLQIGSVLVMDGEKLTGIITTYDVCRILRNLLEDKPILNRDD